MSSLSTVCSTKLCFSVKNNLSTLPSPKNYVLKMCHNAACSFYFDFRPNCTTLSLIEIWSDDVTKNEFLKLWDLLRYSESIWWRMPTCQKSISYRQTKGKIQIKVKCRLQTRGKMQTADCRPGVKCRLSVSKILNKKREDQLPIKWIRRIPV